MKKLFLTGLLMGCMTLKVFSQNENLIPRKTLFLAQQKNSIKLAPSGDFVYYRSTADNEIYFYRTDKPEKPEKLTTPAPLRSWEPYENGVLGITTDTLQPIVKISHDGKTENYSFPHKCQSIRIVYASPKGQFALEVQAKEEKNSGYYRFDPAKSKFEKVASLFTGVTPLFDFNGNLIAGNTENILGGNSLLLYNKSKKQFDTLLNGVFSEDIFLGGFTRAIAVSGDGKKVYYTSNQLTDKSELYVYDTKTQKSTSLAKHDKMDILPFGFSTNTKGEVSSVVGLFAKTIRVVTDEKQQANFDYVASKMKGDISYGGNSTDGTKWLIREFTGGPSNYYLFNTTTQSLTYLFQDVEGLETYTLAQRTAFEVTTRDGVSLPVHVYLPAGSDQNADGIPDKPLPTILYVHGGPWSGVSNWNHYLFWRNFQLLANRGYAVINCEFRGGLGYGKEFIRKSYKTWGKEMTNDKTDIARWAQEKGIADKTKTAIFGWSYGGYAAMAGIALSPDTYSCAISMYGISDLVSFGKTDFANNDYWKERVGDPDTEWEMLKKYSPIHYIDQIKAPLLLTTGGKDDRIPPAQADSMAVALKKAGKEVSYYYYPNEEHDYRKEENWISFWAIAEEFLATHLGVRNEEMEPDKSLGEFEER